MISFKKVFSEIIRLLTDLLYPEKCMFCDNILSSDERGRGICPGCQDIIPFVGEACCSCCGLALSDPAEEYCDSCQKRLDEYEPHAFDAGRSLLIYTDSVSKLIARYKFKNQQYLADKLAEMMAEHMEDDIKAMGTKFLVPVPLHKIRLKERGFDQTALLAEKLAEKLNDQISDLYADSSEEPYTVCKLLERNKQTAAMKELDFDERAENIAAAIDVRADIPRLPTPTSVILVDDIYTTGSTLDACAEVLKRAGVKKVYFITAATGKR